MLLSSLFFLSTAYAAASSQTAFIFANNQSVSRRDYESACNGKGLNIANLTTISRSLLKELSGYPQGKAWIGSLQGNDFGGAPMWLDKHGRVRILLKANAKTKSLKRLALCQNVPPQPVLPVEPGKPVLSRLPSLAPSPVTTLEENKSDSDKKSSTKEEDKFDIDDVLEKVDQIISGKSSTRVKHTVFLESSSEQDSQELDSLSEEEDPTLKFSTSRKTKGRKTIVKLPRSSNSEKRMQFTISPAAPTATTKEVPVSENKNANQPRPATSAKSSDPKPKSIEQPSTKQNETLAEISIEDSEEHEHKKENTTAESSGDESEEHSHDSHGQHEDKSNQSTDEETTAHAAETRIEEQKEEPPKPVENNTTTPLL